MQLFKSLSTDNILQLLKEGKASIRVICSHDNIFLKGTLSSYTWIFIC